MFNILSPYNLTIFGSIFFSFIVFYILGAFFSPNLNEAKFNITVRVSIGALVFIAINAFIHSGIKTMLFPFLFILPFFFKLKPQGVFSDLKKIKKTDYLLLLTFFILLLLLYMFLFDIRNEDKIQLGNWDYAFSGGFGNDLYLTASESSRLTWEFTKNRAFYHFGDLWFSGFYSNYIKIIPYYSYSIVYGFIFNFIIFLNLQFFLKNKILSFFYSILVFIIPGIQYLPTIELQIQKLNLIGIEDTLFNVFPYRVLILFFMLFTHLIINKKHFWGFLLLSISSCFHPIFATVIPTFLIFIIIANFLSKKIKNELKLSKKQLLLILLSSSCTYIYSNIDHRFTELNDIILSYSSFTLVFHSTIKIILSLIPFIPFMLGVMLLTKIEKFKLISYLHLFILISVIFNFTIIHSVLKGDSVQIIYLYITGLLIPFGLFGLISSLDNSHNIIKISSFIIIILCLFSLQYRFVKYSSDTTYIQYSLGFDSEWLQLSEMRQDEVNFIINLFQKNEKVDVAYSISSDSSSFYNEQIYMQHFPFLKGLISGTEFHRISIIPIDTFSRNTDIPRKLFFENSILNHYYTKSLNREDLNIKMIKNIKPAYFIVDKLNYQSELFPNYKDYINKIDTTNRFLILTLEK